ncbi:tocopherol cyclase family protein [Clostridium sp. HCS.1]|uniref:tocopherol cyclase family protein n=1 Tax=Clostridium sp. HCS.1 TaxID=3238594 RepID=UPI003A1001C9
MKNKENYTKKKGYFEGWYFKHQSKELSISFIPGININRNGDKYAFIQIITENKSYNVNYDYKDFSISKDKLTIKIKDNIFSLSGVIVNIKNKDINIKGRLIYKNITPIKKDIMGPFAHLPFMECFHGVLSLNHTLEGSLFINYKEFKFNGGKGYIEKDSGTSFPDKYLWVQSNYFKNNDISIMVSIANIPFLGFKFMGCIAIVYYEGMKYILATYNGVKIISYNEKGLIIKKGEYRLEIEIEELHPQKLLAPNGGEMIRTITENISCNARFKFYKGKNLIFKLDSDKTSFEYVSN